MATGVAAGVRAMGEVVTGTEAVTAEEADMDTEGAVMDTVVVAVTAGADMDTVGADMDTGEADMVSATLLKIYKRHVSIGEAEEFLPPPTPLKTQRTNFIKMVYRKIY